MSPHPSRQELEAFARKALSAREILRLDRHLTDCPACLETVDELTARREAGSLLAVAWAAPAHVRYEDLEGLVDRRLDVSQRLAVEAHVAGCGRCRRELADMQGYAPALRGAVAASPSPRAAWWPRLSGWLSGQMPLRLAIAGLALAVGVSVLLREQSASTSTDTSASLDPQALDAARAAFDRSSLDRLAGVSPRALTAVRANDWPTLVGALKAPADRGDAVAQTALGLLLAEGLGVAPDASAAARLWTAAAQRGEASAARNLEVLRYRASARPTQP